MEMEATAQLSTELNKEESARPLHWFNFILEINSSESLAVITAA
jgi:hypothetical protein